MRHSEYGAANVPATRVRVLTNIHAGMPHSLQVETLQLLQVELFQAILQH